MPRAKTPPAPAKKTKTKGSWYQSTRTDHGLTAARCAPYIKTTRPEKGTHRMCMVGVSGDPCYYAYTKGYRHFELVDHMGKFVANVRSLTDCRELLMERYYPDDFRVLVRMLSAQAAQDFTYVLHARAPLPPHVVSKYNLKLQTAD